MPIYEYSCKKCGHEFEKLVSGSNVEVSCESCGSPKVDKLFSTFSPSTSPARPSAPCNSGGCPGSGMAGTGCSGGGCPF